MIVSSLITPDLLPFLLRSMTHALGFMLGYTFCAVIVVPGPSIIALENDHFISIYSGFSTFDSKK